MDNDHASLSEYDYSQLPAVQGVTHIEAGHQKRKLRAFYKRKLRGSPLNILYNIACHNMCMSRELLSAND